LKWGQTWTGWKRGSVEPLNRNTCRMDQITKKGGKAKRSWERHLAWGDLIQKEIPRAKEDSWGKVIKRKEGRTLRPVQEKKFPYWGR